MGANSCSVLLSSEAYSLLQLSVVRREQGQRNAYRGGGDPVLVPVAATGTPPPSLSKGGWLLTFSGRFLEGPRKGAEGLGLA